MSLNILLESDIIKGNTNLDLGIGQKSLGEITKQLNKLLNS
jgi:hypothetical protein